MLNRSSDGSSMNMVILLYHLADTNNN